MRAPVCLYVYVHVCGMLVSGMYVGAMYVGAMYVGAMYVGVYICRSV